MVVFVVCGLYLCLCLILLDSICIFTIATVPFVINHYTYMYTCYRTSVLL